MPRSGESRGEAGREGRGWLNRWDKMLPVSHLTCPSPERVYFAAFLVFVYLTLSQWNIKKKEKEAVYLSSQKPTGRAHTAEWQTGVVNAEGSAQGHQEPDPGASSSHRATPATFHVSALLLKQTNKAQRHCPLSPLFTRILRVIVLACCGSASIFNIPCFIS